MAEWEFIRQMNQNYLQIECNSEKIENLYQYHMISQNKITGLIPSHLRIINGRTYLQYNISSMQCIMSIFYDKELKLEWFSDFVFSLKKVVGVLEEHLLDHRNLQLSPELIFQDIDHGESFFLYYPYSEHLWKENRQKFSDFLLEKVSHENEPLLDMIYDLYDKISDAEDLSWLEDAWKHLEDYEPLQSNFTELNPGNSDFVENSFCQSHNEVEHEQFMDKEMEEVEKLYSERHIKQEEFSELSPGMAKVNKKHGKVKVILVGAAFLGILICGLGYLYTNYVLTPKETGLLVGGIVAATLFISIWSFRQLGTNHSNKEEDLLELFTTSQLKKEEKPDYPEEYEPEINRPQQDDEELEDYGKTRYFEPQEIENKLYGIGKNKQIVELYKFPFTIGKKPKYVDGIILDDSVSRMHARFFYKDEVLCLQDLNSTNGTFKNGLPLEPNEIVPLSKGDEIRFGKIPFAYR